ncbi:MBOAT family protein [candidate division NPL-UPA2 bacterium]|nr:MBOAT family protein [candidate division NPL-UPA2 bacterium]
MVFFLIVYFVYLPLRKTRFWLPWLLAASYFFYGWWNPLYLSLIIYSTVLDYFVVLGMEKSEKKRFWLTISVVNNLLLLGFFKYAGFVTENLNILLSRLGISFAIPAPGVLLPVGISFYTFQSMSYTIDFYRGKIKRETSFIRFATFVSLFPQLVAGPIERAKSLLPQLRGKPEIFKENISDGLSLFFVGLFKKVALADYLALYVDRVYAAPALFDSPSLMLATFAFGWQIYFDFSGYTDMARGLARMMGFNLMPNFNNPYLATGLGDFWNRWHISLSTWFKDYVYIPLGGNRRGKFNTYKNMFLTMLISGLWHGAAWTFVIWGALHAVGRFLTRELERTEFYREKVPRLLKQLGVFAFVTFTWIFFRAGSLSDALLIINRIFAFGLTDPRFPLLALFFCLFIWLYQFLYESKIESFLRLAPVRAGVMLFIFLYLWTFGGAGHEAFIYFQF